MNHKTLLMGIFGLLIVVISGCTESKPTPDIPATVDAAVRRALANQIKPTTVSAATATPNPQTATLAPTSGAPTPAPTLALTSRAPTPAPTRTPTLIPPYLVGPPSQVLMVSAAPADMSSFITTWRSEAESVHQLSRDGNVTRQLLAKYGTVVITPLCSAGLNFRFFQDGDIEELQKWTKTGGNLLIMAAEITSGCGPVNLSKNALIASVAGITINFDQVRDDTNNYRGFTEKIANHPITEGVRIVRYGYSVPSLSVSRGTGGQIIVEGSEDANSKYYTHNPPVVAAFEGTGKVVVTTSDREGSCPFGNRCLDEGDNRLLALNILRWFLEKRGESSSKPSQITDQHVARMQDIQNQVKTGTWTQDQAKAGLGDLAAEVGKDGLTWLLKRMPVYDSQTGKYVTLDNFTKDLAGSRSSSGPQPRAQEDPVGTAVELLFGDSSPENIRKLFGLN